VLGDFNEWKRHLPSQVFSSHFESVHEQVRPARITTFPGVMPVLPLDHIYFDPDLRLDALTVHRSRMALVASDHLPLVADFSLPEAEESLPDEAASSLPCASASCEFGGASIRN
jgi:endonuclease/exonuclease/phosphatase family metal-dependent hydrolase